MSTNIANGALSAQAFFTQRLGSTQGSTALPLSDGSSLAQRLGDGIISNQDYQAIKADYAAKVLNRESGTPLSTEEEAVFHQSLGQAINCQDTESLTQALHTLAEHSTEANAVRFNDIRTPTPGPSPIAVGSLKGLPEQGYVPGQDATYEFKQTVTFGQLSEARSAVAGEDMAKPLQVASIDSPFQLAQATAIADQLKPPAGYVEARRSHLATGMNYAEFRLAGNGTDAQGHKTIRAVMISPQQLGKLNVYFSDTYTVPIHISNLAQKKDMLAVMNGTFMGKLPAGDIIGTRVTNGRLPADQRKQPPGMATDSAYTNAETRTGENLDARYSVALTKDNKIEVFRGGISDANRSKYRMSIGGGVLLFDKDQNRAMYDAVGTPAYDALYENSNEAKIVNRGDPLGEAQGGKLKYVKPRSALAVMPNGSMVMINLGEGKQRWDKQGVGPEDLAKLLKRMGAVKAVMLDGGGAPVMDIKDQYGHRIEQTEPYSGYDSNYSFIGLSQ